MPRGHYPRRAKQEEAEVSPPASNDSLEKHRRVEDMGEAELRSYALQVGVYPGDAQRLEVERLRQNVLLKLNELIEEL